MSNGYITFTKMKKIINDISKKQAFKNSHPIFKHYQNVCIKTIMSGILKKNNYCTSAKMFIKRLKKYGLIETINKHLNKTTFCFKIYSKNITQSFKATEYVMSYCGTSLKNILDIFSPINLYREIAKSKYCPSNDIEKYMLQGIFNNHLIIFLAKIFSLIDRKENIIENKSLRNNAKIINKLSQINIQSGQMVLDSLKNKNSIINTELCKCYITDQYDMVDLGIVCDIMLTTANDLMSIIKFFKELSENEYEIEYNIDLTSIIMDPSQFQKTSIYYQNYNYVKKIIDDITNKYSYELNLCTHFIPPSTKLVIDI